MILQNPGTTLVDSVEVYSRIVWRKEGAILKKIVWITTRTARRVVGIPNRSTAEAVAVELSTVEGNEDVRVSPTAGRCFWDVTYVHVAETKREYQEPA